MAKKAFVAEITCKIQCNKKLIEPSKTKRRLLSSYIESPIFNTNRNNIKLQMLLEGLKCKQLEENTIYIIQRELQINNHKVDNGLNEAVIRDN